MVPKWTRSTQHRLATCTLSTKRTKRTRQKQTISFRTPRVHTRSGLVTSPVDLLSRDMYAKATTSYRFPNLVLVFFCTKISVLLRNFLLSFRLRNRCKLWRCWIRQKAAALSWIFSVRSSITHHKLPSLKFICYFACLRLFRESNGRSSAPRRSQVSPTACSQNLSWMYIYLFLWKFTRPVLYLVAQRNRQLLTITLGGWHGAMLQRRLNSFIPSFLSDL